jgi:hypothetical protein
MRRLTNESGATAVIVVLLLTALLGISAIVVDGGLLYFERRQLQNGADAGALAIAQDCSGGACGPYSDTAFELAGLNAIDGESYAEVCGSPGAGLPPCSPAVAAPAGAEFVRVTNRTGDAAGTALLPPTLARAISPEYDGTTVSAAAAVAWGYPRQVQVLPLAISICDWRLGTGVGGNFPPAPPYPPFPANPPFPEQTVKVQGNQSDTCVHNGQTYKGGFGWLAPDTPTSPRSCQATVDANSLEASGSTGASPPNPPHDYDCSPDWFRDNVWKRTVYIPVFSETIGQGSNASYRILGFAAFYVTGYDLTGQHRQPSQVTGDFPCGNDKCFSGYFHEDIIPAISYGGPNLGLVSMNFFQ